MKTSYKIEAFKGCQFNPLIKEKMMSAFPGLAGNLEIEWIADPEIDNLLRYAILVYDPKSPLVTDERDTGHRKDLALDILEIEDDEIRADWIAHRHPFLPDLICLLLFRYIKSREYAMLQAIEFKFWESIRLTLEPIAAGKSKEQLEALQKKSLAGNEMESDITRIDALYRKYFMEDIELEKKAKKSYSSPEQAMKR
jgi:hypothetical protein